MAKEAKLYIDTKLERFEQVVAACLERRDKRWGEDLEKTIKKSRNPLSWLPASFSTPAVLAPPSLHTYIDGVTCTSLPAATAKPPIKMEFPKFSV